jgi:hypothetical protein
MRSASRAFWEKNRKARADLSLPGWGAFGITYGMYDAMFEAQGGMCKACGKPETRETDGRIHRLQIDHCHLTDKLRGLLCWRCNVTVGNVEDDAELLRKLAGYLDAAK